MFSQKQGFVWSSLISCFLLTFLLAACSSSVSAPVSSHVPITPTSTPHGSLMPTLTLGSPGCHPPSPLETSNLGFPEATGTTPARDLWSLFLGGIPPVKKTGKIIWAIGESFQKPIQIVGLGPGGEHLQPLFLEQHSGSHWDHLGEEWGTAFNFPVAGCWDLHVTGGKTVGDVWVLIS